MRITAAQIRALYKETREFHDGGVFDLNPRVKGGVDNHEIILSYSLFKREIIISSTGRPIQH